MLIYYIDYIRVIIIFFFFIIIFFQAEDGIRDLVRSRGLGDVYKRQNLYPKETIEAMADFLKT